MQSHVKDDINYNVLGNMSSAQALSIASETENFTTKMFDLKMCFLDLMRITTNGTRQKKTLKEVSSRNYPQYMHHRYSDMNRIYLNENVSMTSRCSTIKFSRCPTGNFNPNANHSKVSRPTKQQQQSQQPLYEWIDTAKGMKQSLSPSPLGKSYSRFSLNESHLPSITNHRNSDFFDNTSSDERVTSTIEGMSSFTESPLSDSSMRETETDDCLCSYSDCGQTMVDANSANGLDSFCTLCTSSFSFNRCNQCEDSSCGSKCNDRSDDKKLIDGIGDASGGGECTSSGGAISSDCESVQFR